jgi:DNA polymerase III sliding clamp (beta) subunit (PCNA family)
MKKFKVETRSLYDAVNFASNFVAKNPIIEITKDLFLELNPDDKMLTVFGTNLQEGGYINFEIKEITGFTNKTKFLLPKKISTVLKTIDDIDIEIELKEIDSRISEVIFHTKKSKFKFQQNVNGDEFPTLDDYNETNFELNLSFKKLNNALSEVSYSTAKQNNGDSPALENVYINLIKSKNEVELVATDAYRLVCINFKEETIEEDLSFFITPNIASVLQEFKVDEEDSLKIKLIKQGVNVSKIFYKHKNKTIFNQNISAKFPNYNLVLDNNNPYKTELSINIKELKPQLKRIKSILDIYNESDIVQLCIRNNEVKLLREQSDTHIIDEILDIDYNYEQDINIHFSISYLMDLINNINEENFIMKIENPLNPLRITKENKNRFLRGLIMPVRSS